ncbi:MAG TPA: hypothetical protein VKP30_26295 [Polyangiaceae bacterium]|nr:hypothetical protein [Polyangiaceae bacterium]
MNSKEKSWLIKRSLKPSEKGMSAPSTDSSSRFFWLSRTAVLVLVATATIGCDVGCGHSCSSKRDYASHMLLPEECSGVCTVRTGCRCANLIGGGMTSSGTCSVFCEKRGTQDFCESTAECIWGDACARRVDCGALWKENDCHKYGECGWYQNC